MSDFLPYVLTKNKDPNCIGQRGWVALVEYDEEGSTSGGYEQPKQYNPPTIEVTVLVSETYVKNDQEEINSLYKELIKEPYEEKTYLSPLGTPNVVRIYTSQKGKSLKKQIDSLTPGRWNRVYEKRTIPNPNYRPELPDDDVNVVVLGNYNRKTEWIAAGSLAIGVFKDEQQRVELGNNARVIKFLFCGCGDNEIDCDDCCASCCNIAQLVYSKFV